MKKNSFLYQLLWMVAILNMHSCMSDAPEEYEPEKEKQEEKISIKVSMPPNEAIQSKSRVAYVDNNLSLKWEPGDQLAIIGYDDHNICKGKEVLDLESGKDTNVAVFTGNPVNGATQYDIFYPAETVDNQGNIHIDYNSQTQKGNNNADHLKSIILLKQADEKKLTTNEILLEERDIPLQMQNAIIKFELSNLVVSNPTSLKWEIKDNKGDISARILSIQDVYLDGNDTFIGYMCIPSMGINAKTISVSITGAKEGNSQLAPPANFYSIKANKNIFYAPNSRYTATIAKWNTRIYYKSEKNLNVPKTFSPEPTNGVWNGANKQSYLDFEDSDIALINQGDIKTWEIMNLDINGITQIGNDAFSAFNSLRSVILHNGIHTIGNNAFVSCASLATITIPNSVTTIGNTAFSTCSSLNKITLPRSVKTIGKNAFLNCNNLEKLTISAETPPTLAAGENPLGLNSRATIHVPSSAIQKYKEAAGWSFYEKRIKAITP